LKAGGDSEAMGGGVSSCVRADRPCTVLDTCGLLGVCSDAPRVHKLALRSLPWYAVIVVPGTRRVPFR
jgi:hypothetical protein